MRHIYRAIPSNPLVLEYIGPFNELEIRAGGSEVVVVAPVYLGAEVNADLMERTPSLMRSDIVANTYLESSELYIKDLKHLEIVHSYIMRGETQDTTCALVNHYIDGYDTCCTPTTCNH